MKRIGLFWALVLFATVTSTAANDGIIDTASPTKLIYSDFQLADGAAWDGRGTLFVPDVKAAQLLVFNTAKAGEPPRVRLKDSRISGTFYQQAAVYLSDNGNRRISKLPRTGPPETLAQFEDKQRPNDLVVDIHGTVYVTFTGDGVVRRIKPDGNVDVVATGIDSPNGITMSPDGSSLYVSSYKTGAVTRIAVGAADIPWASVPFAQLESTDDGFRGDGMCTDRTGNIYCTGANAVTIWNPTGQQIGQLKTAERPINVIVGGTDARSLYISTFGGLYQQRVNAYGVSPNPPMTETSESPTPTSTAIGDSIKASLNVVYAEIGSRKLLMDVFEPRGGSTGPRPAIVVVHGGGWLKGDKTKFRALALRLAEQGYVTAAIEYRLGFEAKFPAAIRDCNAAVAFLRKNADRYSIAENRIAAVGGSAGGHLVGLMAAGSHVKALHHSELSDTASASLNAAVVLAGPLQTATGSVAERSTDHESNSNAVNWLGKTIGEDPAIYQLADAYEKISKQMPPTLFMCGSLDNPSRNEPSREKMKQLGRPVELVVHDGAKHGHWNQPDWIARVTDDIVAFVEKHL